MSCGPCALHRCNFTYNHFYTQTSLHRNARTHKPLFLRKDYSSTRKIAILLQFLPIEGCSGASQIAILPQFLPIDPHFVRKGCSGTSKIAILPQFLPVDPHFVRKGCVSCRLVCTAPAPAFRREIEKKERARGQEGKRARGEDVKM